MLKPKKKLTKKEMKQDTLITSYAKVTSFYYENKKYINYAITGLVVIVIAIIIYTNNRRANNEKAATELGKVFSIYDAGTSDPRQFQIAIDGQPERGIMGLRAIVDNYGSSPSGDVARFYLANAYLNLGNYDGALKHFKSFDGDNDMLAASAIAGIGTCYEAKGDFEKAASNYEKAARSVADKSAAPDHLLNAARCYGLAGDKEKAISLFKRIKKDFPKSSAARDVDRYIAQFSS
ncbi:MAG: tetratricopeptide repeat protein [Bacteroidota bacterium]|nr:tetratricopeptide repeat protein [Bacteroidota bacterium]